MKKNKAFTLVEILLVIMITSFILVVLFSILTTIPRIKNQNDAKMTLIEQTNYVFERLNLTIQGYDIDYEEYFNRKQVGCHQDPSLGAFQWNPDGHCDIFSSYGNGNHWNAFDYEIHALYYCSSSSDNDGLKKMSQCTDGNLNIKTQSYGQYKQLFWDVGIDTDGANIPGVSFLEVGDSDDRDLGVGPIAIEDSENVTELYLISPDQSKRIMIRRKFIEDRQDGHGNSYPQYTLQILKLKGFDAGEKHNFDTTDSEGVFDGKIDTWACDYDEGFVCQGAEIENTIYSGYHLPLNADDGRVNLLSDAISVTDRNIKIVPIKKPEYAWKEFDQQINPYIKVSIATHLSPHLRSRKLSQGLTGFTYTLQTLFNTKTFYVK